MALEPESLLNNRYRIIEILGQGGMGSVYHAIDENLGVDVAVKDNFFTTEEYARQYRREATILAGLRHPNLPRVTDHFVIEGQGQYLVMGIILPGKTSASAWIAWACCRKRRWLRLGRLFAMPWITLPPAAHQLSTGILSLAM